MLVNGCRNCLFAVAALDARPGKVAVDHMRAGKSAFVLLGWIHVGARHKTYIERDCEAVRFASQRAPERVQRSRVLENEVVGRLERAIPNVITGGFCKAGEKSDAGGDNQRAHGSDSERRRENVKRDRDKPRERVVANTLNSFRSGAPGFIDWLGRLRCGTLGIEAHLAERTTDNVVRGSEWICRRCDHAERVNARAFSREWAASPRAISHSEAATKIRRLGSRSSLRCCFFGPL